MTDQDLRPITRRDWLLIGVLFALVLPLRVWLLCNTEVTARDSIGYIRYALKFDDADWREVCRSNDQHPGYPALVWLMSQPIRAMAGETTPENMQLATQLVGFFSALLLIGPMYFLGRPFFDRGVCFGAVLLFQYLPVSGQHLSDGISEPAYLLVLTTALLQGVHAVGQRSVWRSGLCGLFAGAAYLIRPEGLLVLFALAAVLVALQLRAASRCAWTRFASCGAAILIGVAVCGSVYVNATGRFSNKPSINYVIDNLFKLVTTPRESAETDVLRSNLCFAATFPPIDNRAVRLQRSIWALTSEVAQGFHYVAVISAVLGFFAAYGSLKRNPGFWLLVTYGVLHAFILVSLAMSVNYVSDRHVVVLVLGGSYYSVFGLQEMGRRLAALMQPAVTGESPAPAPWWRRAGFITSVIFVALVAICLPKVTQRLHGNRAANRQAGVWLAEHVRPGDVVVDDHSWSHFYSGLIFQEGREPALPADHRGACYVVMTRSNDPVINAQRMSVAAQNDTRVVYYSPQHGELAKARVIVYRQERDFKTHPWRIAAK